MTKINFWKKYHRFQKKPGWCGPAVIQMVLLASGVKKTQQDIARSVYKKWWGTSQQLILAYLSSFFKIVNYKHGATMKDVSFHINKGHYVILNWWDDIDSEDQEGGHYSIAGAYDHKLRAITLVDPSNARLGIWIMADKEFNKKWYDTLDVHDRIWIEGWMLWVDPKSKIEPKKV